MNPQSDDIDAWFDKVHSSKKGSGKPAQEDFDYSDIDEEFKKIRSKKRSMPEKAARIAGQYAIGAAENLLLPYELSAAQLSSPEAQEAVYRGNVAEDIEQLLEKKQTGVWDEKDQEFLDHLTEQLRNPEKSREFVQTADIGVRGIAEKITGQDLHSEGILEKGASFAGILKNPSQILQLRKLGTSPKQVMKAISPSSDQILRGAGAGTALELAEDGQFGPIGSLAALVVGDVIGGKTKAAAKAIASPKQALANLAAKLPSAEKKALQQDLIKTFREAGIQPDIGTITDNSLIQGIQARLAASSLTGKPLQEMKERLLEDVKTQYEEMANTLGKKRFETLHEAGEAGKEMLTKIRDEDKKIHSKLYTDARNRIENKFIPAVGDSREITAKINKLENALAPGGIKSAEQKATLEVLQNFKKDLIDESGKAKPVKILDLMNNKVALNDIINYEVQGGQKQLLKALLGDIDEVIMEYGKKDKQFLNDYMQANKEFARHAKTFRNDNISQILKSEDPMTLMNKMNSVQGQRDLKKALSRFPSGKETYDELARFKLDQMIGNKMTDNVAQQLKSGTFANLLKNQKDRDLVRELLGPKAFARLDRLQKAVGKLEKTARKFFNASQSGTTLLDAALIGQVFHDISMILSGNPWAVLKTAASFGGAKYLTKLFADESFLKMVEDALLASKAKDTSRLLKIGEKMQKPVQQALMSGHDQYE